MQQQFLHLQHFNPEIKTLQAEIRELESKISRASNEKIELEKLIHQFSVLYYRELGDLLLKLLEWRKNKMKGTPEQKEADEDYENFYRQYESAGRESVFLLTNDELVELKANYRKASKLCHPDVVSDEYKELAIQLFAELNNAYCSNDLQKVNEILFDLQHGICFVSLSGAISDQQMLKVKIYNLKKRLKQLNKELAMIMKSEAYMTIMLIDDWDRYFEKRREELQTQLNKFENGA